MYIILHLSLYYDLCLIMISINFFYLTEWILAVINVVAPKI